MEAEPIDLVADASEAHAAQSRLNTRVAVTVALLATFMGVCKVKDDNIVQAMQQAQADRIDHWSSIRRATCAKRWRMRRPIS
jgi:Domain of unknown function (DUF4337)